MWRSIPSTKPVSAKRRPPVTVRRAACGIGAALMLAAAGCRGGASMGLFEPSRSGSARNVVSKSKQHEGTLSKVMKLEQSPVVPVAYDEPAEDVVVQQEVTNGADAIAPPAPEAPSPVFDRSRPVVEVTFNQVVYSAINHHPVVAAGMQSICQANGDHLQSTLLPNPTLFTDGQLMPLTRPFTVTKQGGPPQFDAILTYPIDWFVFGKRAARMQAANLNVQVSQAEFEELVRDRILLAATAFYNALEAVALLELADENVQNFERLEQITRKGVDNSELAPLELNRVKLDVLAAKQLHRAAQAAALSAAAELRSVTGQDVPGSIIQPVGDLMAPLRGGAMNIEQAVALAEQRRPDMNALRWRVAQAGAKICVEETASRPTLEPALGYTRQFQDSIGFPDANSWSASLTMSVPIFDKNQGNIAKANATQRQLQWEYQALRLTVRSEVEQAVVELDAAFENASMIAGEQLALAATVQESIARAYAAGERSLLDVLDAQRKYRETNQLHVTTHAAYWRARYRYDAAIGSQDARPQPGL